jgi:hypothetical protein
MSPYGLQKTLTEIGDDTSKAIDKNVQNVPKKSERKNNYQAPQNKTGSYGEKRKPGDYLK